MKFDFVNKKIIVVSIFIFILNFLFHFLTLTDLGIWYDEVFSVYHSQKELYMIKNVSEWDIAPPFYYYLLHYWMLIFGIGEVEVRTMSILFTALASFFLFHFTLRYFNLNAAIYASILFFTSNQVYFFSQEARTYSLLFLLVILSSFCFCELLINTKWYHFIFLGLINWAAIYAHYFFLIIPLIQLLVVLINGKKKTILFFLFSLALTVLLFGKWLYRIYDVFSHGSLSSQLNEEITIIQLLQFLQIFIGESPAIYFTVLLLCIGIYFYLKSKVKYNIQIILQLYIIFAALLPILILYVLGLNKSGIFTPRYILFCIPALHILIAYYLSFIKVRPYIRYSIMCSLLITGLYSINYSFSNYTDYKSAVPVVIREKDSDALVIVQTTTLKPLFTYYFDRTIFINNDSIELKLINKNVLFVDDSTNMKMNTIDGYKKIILLQTWPPSPDNMALYLDKRFENKIIKNEFAQAAITIYTNPYSDTLISKKSRIENLKHAL